MQLYKELKEVTLAMQEAPLLDRKAGHEKIFEANVKKEMASWHQSVFSWGPVFYPRSRCHCPGDGRAGRGYCIKATKTQRELAALKESGGNQTNHDGHAQRWPIGKPEDTGRERGLYPFGG